MHIRKATANDAPQVGALIAEFQQYLRDLGDTTQFAFGADAYLRDGFGDRPAFEGLVAENGDTIVGYALYHPGYNTDQAQRVLFMVDLYVRQTSRGQGVGEALMRSVAEAGRAQNAWAIVWAVFKPNKLAARFYQRLGAQYIKDLDWMTLPIDEAA